MIEFKHFIYLDVHRTGSTHIINVLRQISESKERFLWRHYPVSTAGWLIRPGNRMVFASVRNPWSWYVSLWGHGLDGHSAIRRFMSAKLPRTEVDSYYDKNQPVVSFQKWLAAIHDPRLANHILEENYPHSGLSPIMGLYTYRFLRVTTLFPWFRLTHRTIRHAGQIQEFLHRRKIYLRMLRTESLTEEFALFVRDNLDRCHFKSDAEAIVRNASHKKRNSSTKALPHYRDYYDSKSRDLVADRDRLFLEEFGYEF